MSEQDRPNGATTEGKSDSQEKKMMGGSLAISVLMHAMILLIIGSIVIVPAAVEKFMPVTSVAPPPMDIPEPPPLDEVVTESVEEAGTPIGEVQEASPQPQNVSDIDALVVDSTAANAPRLNASSSTTGIMDNNAFASRTGGGLGGSGGGAGRGIGKKTFFGATEKVDNTLTGRFYDLKMDRSRKPLPEASYQKMFVDSNFSAAAFQQCYMAKVPLYASHLLIPNLESVEAPKAFGAEKDIREDSFVVHYTGYVAPLTSMTVRFAGYGDDWLIVGIDGKVTLDGSYNTYHGGTATAWRSSEPGVFIFSQNKFCYGDWIEWKANEFKRIDILIGDAIAKPPAIGKTSAALYIQVKGKNYEKLPNGILKLPLFQLSSEKIKLPETAKENSNYIAFEVTGPIFKAKQQVTPAP